VPIKNFFENQSTFGDDIDKTCRLYRPTILGHTKQLLRLFMLEMGLSD